MSSDHVPGSEYDRPTHDDGADPCAYTDYERADDEFGESVEYEETQSVEGQMPATGRGATGLERRVWEALYAVEDPEMPVSIVDLGLVYGVAVDEEAGTAAVDMTLTYTGCPARDMLLGEVERAVADVEGIDGTDDVDLRLVWSPGWTVDMVTERGREALREFGVSV